MPSYAKVEINGSDSSLSVSASGDTISKVLAALSKVARVRYRTSLPLEVVISGTYSGPVERVIARLLQDYSFAIAHHGGVLEVVVYGRWLSDASAQKASASQTPTPVPLQTPVPPAVAAAANTHRYNEPPRLPPPSASARRGS